MGFDAMIFAGVLNSTLARMPYLKGAAWVLINLRGLTQQETATILGVSQSWAARLNEAARADLKEALS